MPHAAQVRVNPSHHLLGSMPEFPAHDVQAHRCAAVECLQSGCTVRMAKDAVPDLEADLKQAEQLNDPLRCMAINRRLLELEKVEQGIRDIGTTDPPPS
jgi:hypothetical protein